MGVCTAHEDPHPLHAPGAGLALLWPHHPWNRVRIPLGLGFGYSPKGTQPQGDTASKGYSPKGYVGLEAVATEQFPTSVGCGGGTRDKC